MKKTTNILTYGAWLLTLAVTALLYSRLPEQVPTHFDFDGTPNSWQPRAVFAVLLPALALVVSLLVRYVGSRSVSARAWSATATMAFLCVLHLGLIGYALDNTINILRLVGVAAGALFVGLGLLLPRLEQNRWIGVRTAATLRSPEAWARAQRVGGLMFCVGGLCTMVVAWLAPTLGTVAVLVTALGTAVVASWYAARTPA